MDPDRAEPSWRSGNTHGFCVTGALPPIASEPNPVASALGNPARRDPGGAVRTYHEGRKLVFKTGTFYLAGNRNFLFGSNTRTTSVVWKPVGSRARTVFVWNLDLRATALPEDISRAGHIDSLVRIELKSPIL